MKTRVQSLCFLSALVLFLSFCISLNAQQTTPPTQPPDAQAQQPASPDQAQPSQTPSQTPSPTPDKAEKPASSAQGESAQLAASQTGAQNFTGTVVKSGDKYMFQDEATGNTYDIDHQNELQKFEGKKVKVRGSLDASTKTIHVQ